MDANWVWCTHSIKSSEVFFFSFLVWIFAIKMSVFVGNSPVVISQRFHVVYHSYLVRYTGRNGIIRVCETGPDDAVIVPLPDWTERIPYFNYLILTRIFDYKIKMLWPFRLNQFMDVLLGPFISTPWWIPCENLTNCQRPGGSLLIWINLIPTWISNYTHYMVWDEITYLSPAFNGTTPGVRTSIISSHTLLGMRLLIHAGIKINPC